MRYRSFSKLMSAYFFAVYGLIFRSLLYWFTLLCGRPMQGRSDGGYIGIYTHPKSGQVNFLCCNSDESTYNVLRNTMSIKILYLPKTNFWLRPWSYAALRVTAELHYTDTGYTNTTNEHNQRTKTCHIPTS